MARYNLLDEEWIPVQYKDKQRTSKVSIRELFNNAPDYRFLAGDSKTQNFAVFRFLLSILQTIYSRVDAEDKPYTFLNLDEKFKPFEDLDEDDITEYEEALEETWYNLWEKGKFTPIVNAYLDAWKDRFYLFDKDYPFYQVRDEDIKQRKLSRNNPGSVTGKTINRLVSESGNKLALFSPKYDQGKNKEILSEEEIARWLITFQSYTGLSDKVKFNELDYKNSKGWLFDLGGIYLEGDNLFESLMLNLALVHPEDQFKGKMQRPSWEYTSEELLDRYLSDQEVDNLAELYTNWSRAIYIDPETDVTKPFTLELVKLPDLPHANNFLELMTMWRHNSSGDNKDKFTPKKHPKNQALWRSFGSIAYTTRQDSNEEKTPGILKFLDNLLNGDEEEDANEDTKEKTSLNKVDNEETNEDTKEKISLNGDLSILAVSMEDDGNATSWMPVDEIFDDLIINPFLLTEKKDNGNLMRIVDVVEETKKVVTRTYGHFLKDIETIRNLKSKSLSGPKLAQAYFLLDTPFKAWIASITKETNMAEKENEWYDKLKKVLRNEAKQFLEEATVRDYKGVIVEVKIKNKGTERRPLNLAIAYNSFNHFLNKIPSGGGNNAK